MKEFEVMSNPQEIYKKMLVDINNAKESILLETYIYSNDKIGRAFRDLLEKKAKQGIKINVLIDSWGSDVNKKFFLKLKELGGEVKFFKEFQYVLRFFSKNHERNHKKLLIIDNNITYIGSMNITASCLNWRELVVKLNGPIAEHFTSSFFKSWNLYGKITKTRINSIFHKGFEIIHDIPHAASRLLENKYLELLKNAKKEIRIETPYFIPSYRIRRELYRAEERGVDVKIILPNNSDLTFMDIFRNRYLGKLNRKGVKIYYYMPKTLHSKLLLVDGKFFLLGSSNLDYRSFVHQHEINLFGKDKKIIQSLEAFYDLGLKQSKQFDYSEWKNRSTLKKLIEIFMYHLRHYL